MARKPIRTSKTTIEEPPTASVGTFPTVDVPLRKLLSLAWPFFTVMWLVFPIGSVAQMLRADLTTSQLLAFLTSMAAYITIFLWLMLRYPISGAQSSLPERRIRIGLLVALATLALYLELTYGSAIPYHFMFVVIAAAVTLPTRYATLAVVMVVLVVSGIYATRSGWEVVAATWESAIAPFVIVGFSMILVSRLVVTVRELEAAREKISRLAVAEERLRFARDLHDLLGHSLSQITLKSELAGRLLPATPEKAALEIRDIEDTARKALREVRQAVAGYRQPTLAGELEGARGMLEAADISCQVEDRAGTLPNTADAVLAWTVREGVTNVIRHSQADRCEIQLTQSNGEVHAEVSDNGTGSPSELDETSGSGLSGLAERVARGGGDFEAGPLPDGGFGLRVSLPLQEARASSTGTVSHTDGQQ